MRKRLEKLLEVLQEVPEVPVDLTAAVQALPAVGALPPPQITWPLLSLLHYLNRRKWAWKVVQQQLRPSLRQAHGCDKSEMEAPAEPVPMSRRVPGLPDWEFEIGELGVHLSHQTSGEDWFLEDLSGSDEIWMDLYYDYLDQYVRPPLVVSRLLQLYPRLGAFDVALLVLLEAGLLTEEIDQDLCMANHVWAVGPAVECFLGGGEEPRPWLWRAACIGDWLAAHSVAQTLADPALIEVTGRRATDCQRQWLQWLESQVARCGLDGPLLWALADAGASNLRPYLEEALTGSLEGAGRSSQDGWRASGLAEALIDLVADDPRWCPQIFQALVQGKGGWESRSIEQGVKYLVRYDYRLPELVAARASHTEGSGLVELLEVAATNVPGMVLPVVRKALRSWNTGACEAVIAVLAALDVAWGRQEMIDALATYDSWLETVDLREVLVQSRDEAAQQAVRQWEDEHAADRSPVCDNENSLQKVRARLQAEQRKQKALELSETVEALRSFQPPVT